MRDLCEKTGQWIEGETLIKQKLSRLLLTRKGSQTVLRDFGTSLRSMVDLPFQEFKLHATQEIYQTLEKYAPEFSCEGIDYSLKEGKISMLLRGNVDKQRINYALSP